ncbi:MAG: glycosyltransferase family 39 protein [Sandaracinaceae bacterium]|nr:glycosyltransferase family 39 protein [Sandaracinaceae bacterium]
MPPRAAAAPRGETPIGVVDIVAGLALATAWVAVVRPGGLDLPFFWDEADVYVPGSVWVADHGLDVTPGVFPDDYSRGHPPLLYLLAGAAFAAFGASPTVGHALVLPFTVAALAGTYLLGAQLFDRRAGAAAALGLGVTPLFMSMGNMLLPEMPLTALAVLSFLALARGRVGVAAALGAAAVLMKETGIFAAAGVGAAVLFDAWQQKTLRTRAGALRVALSTAPLWALGLFFVWQKGTAGYFVYPHHANLFADRPFEAANLVTVFPSLLAWHGRWALGLGAVLAVGIASRQTTSAPAPAPLARWTPSRAAVLVGALVLGLANAAFFAKMFWLERYALPVHPLLLVAACGALFRPATPERATPAHALPWVPVLATALLGALSMRAPTTADSEEHTFAYADVIATHRAAFEGLDRPGARVLTTWPMTVELRHAYLGYVARDTEAPDARYLEPGDDVAFTDAVVNPSSDLADAVRDRARRRGMRLRSTHRVGVAPPLERWGP